MTGPSSPSGGLFSRAASGGETVDEETLSAAQEAFWAIVARAFPNIQTGDFSWDAQAAFDQACKDAINHWVQGNSQPGA